MIHRLVPPRWRAAALSVLAAIGLSLPIVGFLHRTAQAETSSGSEVTVPKPRGVMADAVFRPHETTAGDRARSVAGIGALLGLCWLFSRQRSAIDWRLV